MCVFRGLSSGWFGVWRSPRVRGLVLRVSSRLVLLGVPVVGGGAGVVAIWAVGDAGGAVDAADRAAMPETIDEELRWAYRGAGW